MTRKDRRPRRTRLVVALGGIVALVASTAACSSSGDGGGGGKGKIVVAAYGGTTAALQQKYLYDQFTKDTGIKVEVDTVPGQQVAGIEAQNAAHKIKWDLSLGLADTDMATLKSKDLLATMPPDLLTAIKANIPGVQSWGIPSKNGAVLIVCNEKIVEKCPTNAAELFDTKDFPGGRMFPSFQPLVLMGLALESVGTPKDQIFPSDPTAANANIDKAFAAMKTLRPSIKTFYSSSTTAIQLMSQGEVAIAGLWNSASSILAKSPSAHLKLQYTWNQAITYSQWDVVYKGAPDEQNAWKFMQWMNDNPQWVTKYSAEAPSGTTNPQVFNGLPASVQQWVPATSGARKAEAVESDALWMASDPSRNAKINSFWQSYTGGG